MKLALANAMWMNMLFVFICYPIVICSQVLNLYSGHMLVGFDFITYFFYVPYYQQLLDGMIAEYESSSLGPRKWKMLAVFLQQWSVPLYLIYIFIF